MKNNYINNYFSYNIILILIVLLVYTFFFIDEELLVSLMTTIVLIGVYNLLYKSINTMFLLNINQVFQKFSLYIIMHLSIVNRLILAFKNVSLVSTYNLIYINIVQRTFSKLLLVEKLFLRSVNLVIHNFILLYLSRASFKFYNRGSKLFSILKNNSLLYSSVELKSNFIVSVAKLLLK